MMRARQTELRRARELAEANPQRQAGAGETGPIAGGRARGGQERSGIAADFHRHRHGRGGNQADHVLLYEGNAKAAEPTIVKKGAPRGAGHRTRPVR